MSDKVAATIVTYNRLEILKKIIPALRSQSRKPDEIFVVDNSSTDGTREWLASQDNLTILHQDNLGSSGGQHTIIKAAFEKGYDWIWTMDDDVIPRQGCLETLLDREYEKYLIRSPLLYNTEGKPHLQIAISYNLSNPFRGFWNALIEPEHSLLGSFEAIGITFEGPLINRRVIERIGLPEKDFFIYADDTEYFIRASKNNFKIIVICSANFDRQLPSPAHSAGFSWKHYYFIRNIIAIDKLHGNLPVRLLRPLEVLLVWLSRCRKFSDIKTAFKAFNDGYFYKKAAK